MTLFEDFVDTTALYLTGYTANQDQVTSLNGAVLSTDYTIVVDDGTVVPESSLIEVGSELMWVESVATNTVTIAPFGRGYRGTTAAGHADGAKVTISPTIPRAIVERAINDTIRSVYPVVFGTASVEFVTTQTAATYAMPADFERVLAVSREVPGPTDEWFPVRRYRVDQNGTSGNTLSVYDAISPGVTVRVTYTTVPVGLTDGDLFTDSGLRDSCQDLVQFGAGARLAPWFDMGNAPGVAAEANYAAAVGRQSGAVATARYFTQMFQLRLQEEAAALGNLYPVRSHYTR